MTQNDRRFAKTVHSDKTYICRHARTRRQGVTIRRKHFSYLTLCDVALQCPARWLWMNKKQTKPTVQSPKKGIQRPYNKGTLRYIYVPYNTDTQATNLYVIIYMCVCVLCICIVIFFIKTYTYTTHTEMPLLCMRREIPIAFYMCFSWPMTIIEWAMANYILYIYHIHV